MLNKPTRNLHEKTIENMLRCPQCNRLIGKGTIESGSLQIKCSRCKNLLILSNSSIILDSRSFNQDIRTKRGH